MTRHIRILLLVSISFSTYATSLAFAEPYKPIAAYSDSPSFSEYEICAAAISRSMHRPVNIMQAKTDDGKVYFVKYKSDTDGKTWDYKCYTHKNRVVWGTPKGRWRISQEDSLITYEIKGPQLIITEDWRDGSKSEKTYSKQNFLK